MSQGALQIEPDMPSVPVIAVACMEQQGLERELRGIGCRLHDLRGKVARMGLDHHADVIDGAAVEGDGKQQVEVAGAVVEIEIVAGMIAKMGTQRAWPRLVVNLGQKRAECLSKYHSSLGLAGAQGAGDPAKVEAVSPVALEGDPLRLVQGRDCRHEAVMDPLGLGIPRRVHRPVEQDDAARVALRQPWIGMGKARGLIDGEDR
ncbi:hypothetical protein ACFSUK_28340 [Sphingobium scionense]